jgi:hypothetical protein
VILSPAQAEIVRDRRRFRVVDCGRRFGKTTLASLGIAGKAVSKNDTRICYVAPTFQQARDILWRDLKRTLLPVTKNVNESRLEIEVSTQDGGSGFVWLRGWESIETLRGQRFDLLVLDEVASMRNFWLHWQEVLRPTLTDTRGEALFLSTPKGYNHFYDLFQLERPIRTSRASSSRATTTHICRGRNSTPRRPSSPRTASPRSTSRTSGRSTVLFTKTSTGRGTSRPSYRQTVLNESLVLTSVTRTPPQFSRSIRTGTVSTGSFPSGTSRVRRTSRSSSTRGRRPRTPSTLTPPSLTLSRRCAGTP